MKVEKYEKGNELILAFVHRNNSMAVIALIALEEQISQEFLELLPLPALVLLDGRVVRFNFLATEAFSLSLGEDWAWPQSGEADLNGRDYIISSTSIPGGCLLLLVDVSAIKADSKKAKIKALEAANRFEAESQRFQAILTAMPAGVFLYDSEGMLLGVNDSAREIWADSPIAQILEEYRRAEAQSFPDKLFLEPDGWAVNRTLETGKLSREELLGKGGHKAIMNSAAPVLDNDGNIVGAVAVSLDVTEERLISILLSLTLKGGNEEEFLNQALELLVKVSPGGKGCIFLGKKGRLICVSSINGLPLDETASPPCSLMEGSIACGKDCLLGPDEHCLPLRYNGEFLGLLRLSFSSLKGQKLKIDCLETAATIIAGYINRSQTETEIKHYREHLETLVEERTRELARANSLLRQEMIQRRRLEADLTHFFNLSRDVFIITDYDGQVVNINDAVKEIMGYSLSELNSSTLSSFVHPEDLAIFNGAVDKMLKQGMAVEGKIVRFRAADGRWRWLDWNGVPLPRERLIYVVGRDITLRRRMDEEMAHLERLSLIGQIAAGIGHEIRNPLTTVRGALQLLEWNASAETAHYLHITRQELDRATNIISEFLSLSKSHSRRELCDINQLVHELLVLVEADARRWGKAVRFEPGEIPMLDINDGEIRQLLMNLARNGLEAMEQGGTLTVITQAKRRDVLILVQNDGPQISPEVLKQMGTPFFTTKERGTGLGLAVCHAIAQRHNARLTCKSMPQRTTFTLRFVEALSSPKGLVK